MSHEKFEFEPIGNPQQVIEETTGDLERDIYDEKERDNIVTKLQLARAMARPGSDEQQEIDRLLRDIRERYSDDDED